MSDPAIRILGVNKHFGTTHAVRNLDFEVPVGSVCGFLGPNGAGKSTTIRMIMSIIYPDSGSIDVLGGTALVLKDRIELPGLARKRCQELSKGMQQKVQFLAAIIHEPDLLILDEPFSGLDPVNADIVNRLIRELNASGSTIIFSTHVLHQAEQICDRILLINHGEKLLDATLDEIRERFDPRTITVAPLDGTADLDDLEGVLGTSRLGTGDTLELEVDEGADPQRIMRDVLERHPIRSIELRRLSLEEVFVRVVRRGQGAVEANRVRQELTNE